MREAAKLHQIENKMENNQYFTGFIEKLQKDISNQVTS